LPGCPDFVLPRYRQIVFVHGCFWHQHPGCPYAYTTKSRQAFWSSKLEGNALRDKKTSAKLRRLRWHVSVIWECQTKDDAMLSHRIDQVTRKMRTRIRPRT
jgi:DNA mismatch endonuclease (patch repair protein)